MKLPVLFIPHGGGPMPLLGESNHRDLTLFLQSIATTIPRPTSILVISAHWEEEIATISSGKSPEMFFDYYGFPPEAYQFKYPALGNPELANTINNLLKEHGIASKLDEKRGFDHGTFVPLMLMYPLADIPVIQLSLISSLDPYKHIALGRALESLREQGVLILGSGMSFHNMSAFFSGDSSAQNKSKVFDTWLSETLMSNELNFSDQTTRLINWTHAPEARFCHPREEHLLPLHVCFGAGAKPSVRATKVFGGSLYNTTISAYLWA